MKSNKCRTDSVVNNIDERDISTILRIGGESVSIEIKSVKFGDVGDKKSIILDEQMLNARLNDMISCFAKSTSKYNPMPKKVIIYNEENNIENESNNRLVSNKVEKRKVVTEKISEEQYFNEIENCKN